VPLSAGEKPEEFDPALLEWMQFEKVGGGPMVIDMDDAAFVRF